jgi:hypothetical protein
MTAVGTKAPRGASFVKAPSMVLHNARYSEDGFGKYAVGTMSARELSSALQSGFLVVKPEEQRGNDPVSGAEILQPKKIENWVERESKGTLFVGQVTYATFIESGTTTTAKLVEGAPGELTTRDIEVYGVTAMPDGRQRTFTMDKVITRYDNGQEPNYNPDREVDVRLYLNLASAGRKEVFAQMNGGRGGDHAAQSTIEWMAPDNHYQVIAKYLVQHSPYLGPDNVNVVQNTVRRSDHRLAGFHSFVNAVGLAFRIKGRELTQREADAIQIYLPTFWDKLVDVRPELEILPLGERQLARQEKLTSNPLFIYGALAIAAQLFWEGARTHTAPNLSLLEGLRGPTGDKFFSVDNKLWKNNSVMSPVIDRKTATIKGYSPLNNFQTRTAFAHATVDFMNNVNQQP